MADEIKWAIQNGDTEQVENLFKKAEFDVNGKVGPRAPIHYAADYGQQDVLKLLLNKGANINSKDNHGITAVLASIWEGHFDCVELLLEKGADPNGKTPDGKSYLEVAGSDELKNLLKKHGSK